ncbi:MAG: hypothetical protein NT062_31795 [Proteobacteria bacterium]|nr:hypothetical protein [Pseudomonadota bacterium]
MLPAEPLPPPPSRMSPVRASTNVGMHRMPTPVPGMPGAVPIIAAFTPEPATPSHHPTISRPTAPTTGRGKVVLLALLALLVLAVVGYIVTHPAVLR